MQASRQAEQYVTESSPEDKAAGEHENLFGLRQPGTDLPFVRSQISEWIAMTALYNQLSLSCRHFSSVPSPLLLQECVLEK